jgi:hypothetical protein
MNNREIQLAPCDEMVGVAFEMLCYMRRLEGQCKSEENPQKDIIVKHPLFRDASLEISFSNLPHKVIYLQMGKQKYEFHHSTSHRLQTICELYEVKSFFRLWKRFPEYDTNWCTYTGAGNKAGALEMSRNLIKLLNNLAV